MIKPRYIVKRRKIIMTEYLVIDTHLGKDRIVGQTNSIDDAFLSACNGNNSELNWNGIKWTTQLLMKYMGDYKEKDKQGGKGGINP